MLDRVHIVLLRPQGAANLGSVARALKNFGLSRLTLVDSRIPDWADAWRMAVHAEDVLRGAQTADSLAAVLAPSSWVVATSSAPLSNLRVLTPHEVASEAEQHGELTLLFGGEQHGLYPAELLRCHAAAAIPVAPPQPSLNLAQAVCVFASALYDRHGTGRHTVPPAPAASAAMLQHLERMLGQLLDDSAWADATRSKHALAELMQPFWRARLTDDEVRSWLVALGKAIQRPRR